MSLVTLTEAASGSTVQIAVGATLSLRLAENPSTGYRWQLTLGSGLVSVADDYTPGLPAAAGVVGSGGERLFKIQATQAGDTALSARLRRGWDAASEPVRRFDLRLQVR